MGVEKNWLQGREFCRQQNMSMVEILSERDIVRVQNIMKLKYRDNIWIGVSTVEWRESVENSNDSNALCVSFHFRDKEYNLYKCLNTFPAHTYSLFCETGK